MRLFNYFIFPFFIIAFGGCNENKHTSALESDGGLMGSWQLYERGYSIGGGYIVESVSPEPAQILIFQEESMFSSVQGMENFRFYEILTDTVTHSEFIGFSDKPAHEDDNAGPTFSFIIKGDMLKLSFRYCIEGCHLEFKRISSANILTPIPLNKQTDRQHD